MKIRLENINFSYENKLILKDFNLSINDGETIALIGHNGSGKSTLAKLIMGLLEPNSGSIYVNDVLLNEETCDSIRLDMGIIFQNPDNQFVGVTVKDDIAFGLENRSISVDEMNKRINKYLSLVDMSDHLDANPEDLSGGQKQRVAIAGAMAMETNLLIFDESTSMLDPLGTKEVNKMIKTIKESCNKTIILITHDLEEALNADRVIVLNQGMVVLDGAPHDVFLKSEILSECGLKTIDSVNLLNKLSKEHYPNKKEIEEVLWELTFKM